MALNLRKLGKYMEKKQRKNEKTSPILKVIIKIGLGFFWRKDYCPTLFVERSVRLSPHSAHAFLKQLK